MRKDYKEFVQCECGAEYIVLEPQDIDELQEGIYMSIFTMAYDKPSFWHRFKLAWYTIKNGKPYTDQVCLDLVKVKELNKYLSNYIVMTELDKKHRNKKVNKSNYLTKKGK